MKQTITLILTLILSATVATTSALAAPQTDCPVMGGQINKQLYADHNGKRVYFCCSYCDGEFKKNPEKYIEQMEKAGQQPEIINKETK
ncbi:MAG: hypothetical protein V1706_09425 [Pseudomonadota bacterium]